MGDGTIERYRRWFAYERDSHARVLASLDSTPEPLRGSPGFQKAVNLMAHMVAARRLWLYRLGALPEGPTDIFPQNVALAALPGQVDEMHRAWSGYLETLTDSTVRQTFEYRSLEGPAYRNTIEDILTQLFGHSLYHRGQIALLLREAGAEPAVTDFVFWAREPVSSESAV